MVGSTFFVDAALKFFKGKGGSFNNNSPKARLILLNNPQDEVEGIIQQYMN